MGGIDSVASLVFSALCSLVFAGVAISLFSTGDCSGVTLGEGKSLPFPGVGSGVRVPGVVFVADVVCRVGVRDRRGVGSLNLDRGVRAGMVLRGGGPRSFRALFRGGELSAAGGSKIFFEEDAASAIAAATCPALDWLLIRGVSMAASLVAAAMGGTSFRSLKLPGETGGVILCNGGVPFKGESPALSIVSRVTFGCSTTGGAVSSVVGGGCENKSSGGGGDFSNTGGA